MLFWLTFLAVVLCQNTLLVRIRLLCSTSGMSRLSHARQCCGCDIEPSVVRLRGSVAPPCIQSMLWSLYACDIIDSTVIVLKDPEEWNLYSVRFVLSPLHNSSLLQFSLFMFLFSSAKIKRGLVNFRSTPWVKMVKGIRLAIGLYWSRQWTSGLWVFTSYLILDESVGIKAQRWHEIKLPTR